MAVLRKSVGHAGGGIAGERADLKDAFRLRDLHQHCQQATLDCPRQHPRVVRVDVGLFLDPVQGLALA